MPRQRRSIQSEIRAIGKAFSTIGRSLQRLTPLLAAASQTTNASRRGRKLKLSPERRAALKLQGQYMGFLRNLKPRQKTQVKALTASKGLRAAIALAKKLAKA